MATALLVQVAINLAVLTVGMVIGQFSVLRGRRF